MLVIFVSLLDAFVCVCVCVSVEINTQIDSGYSDQAEERGGLGFVRG